MPGRLAAAAVALCGVCAFLELYCTQPLLPMLAQIFHASKTGVGMTVSAATLGVAISAPIFGALTERLPRKRVIVASLIGHLRADAAGRDLDFARAADLLALSCRASRVPGVIAVLVTYIGEEWPPDRIALIMSFYVSGTALGGFCGRLSAGLLADWFNWRVSFLVLGTAALPGRRRWRCGCRRAVDAHRAPSAATTLPSFPYQVQGLFRIRGWWRRLPWASMCCSRWSGVFTWITFHLAQRRFTCRPRV